MSPISGCIVGDCSYCAMSVDEDAWHDEIFITDSVFVHENCSEKYRQGKRRNGYIKNLEFQNQIMRKLINQKHLDKELEEMLFLYKKG